MEAWGKLGFTAFAFEVLQKSFPVSLFFSFAQMPNPPVPFSFGLGGVEDVGLRGVGAVFGWGIGFPKKCFPVSLFIPVFGGLHLSRASRSKTLLGHGNHVR